MKIALACSPGGHMLQTRRLEAVYEKHDAFFYTFRRGMSEELAKTRRVVFVEDTKRNPFFIIVGFLQSLFQALKERPNVVIANGGGFVVPFCWWCKLFGSKIAFIESFSRVESPSISGKLVHPIADLFIVQWEGMRKFYSKAIYGGAVF